MLFDYLKNNHLSIKTFFDTFAIKTSASDSLIGVEHGHLNNYSGYHSI